MMSMQMDKSDCLALASTGKGTWNALSPLAKLPASHMPLSSAGKPLEARSDILETLSVLAQPDWLITLRIGAGDWPVTECCLCGRKTGPEIAGIRPTPEGRVELMQWPSARELADWWCDANANATESPSQNFIPPPCSVEGFVMVLQAIDAYRRALLGSLLAHEPSMPLLMKTEDFNAHCLSSIRAHDIRWLAPAFVTVVPGFGELKPTGGPDNARVPFDRQFLTTAYHPDTGVAGIGFGEPGQAMGLEFARTWMLAAGMEARLASPEGSRAVDRCFIAPTGITNHWAAFETAPDGTTAINHQTLTGTQLRQNIAAFVEKTAQLSAVSPAPAAIPEPPAPAMAPMKFCSQCGVKMEQSAAFCPDCGARQNP